MTDRKPFFTWRSGLLADSRLTAPEKLVGLVISTHMNDHGHGAFPSQERIAAEASLSDRKVRDAVKRLQNLCWLYVSKSRAQGQRWATSNYEIRFPDSLDQPERGSGDEKDAPQSPPVAPSGQDFRRPERGSGDQPEAGAGHEPLPERDAGDERVLPESGSKGPEHGSGHYRNDVPTNSSFNSPSNLGDHRNSRSKPSPMGEPESPARKLEVARRMLKELSERRPEAESLIEHWQSEIKRLEQELEAA